MPDNICYIEISVSDLEAAKAFYGQAFGWEFKMSGEDYAMFADSFGLHGALTFESKCPPDGPFLPYIGVADIAGALDHVVKAGGRVERPRTSIGQYGFIATFRDTCGNLVGLAART